MAEWSIAVVLKTGRIGYDVVFRFCRRIPSQIGRVSLSSARTRQRRGAVRSVCTARADHLERGEIQDGFASRSIHQSFRSHLVTPVQLGLEMDDVQQAQDRKSTRLNSSH